jgi:hypothetical protein
MFRQLKIQIGPIQWSYFWGALSHAQPLTTPITTPKFIVVINIHEVTCTLSPWVPHWIICISFQKINPQACAFFKVLVNDTQFNNLFYFLLMINYPTNIMIGNKCITQWHQTSWYALCAPICRVKFFDLLQQTIIKNEKLMVWHSMLVKGATLHNSWVQ